MDLEAADAMARRLVQEHGLEGWSLVWDGARTRAGACRYSRREISLSRVLTALHDEAEVRDTVLHEVAHALVGPGAGHGPEWRAAALAIGCSGRRCSSPDAPRAPGAWLGTCPAGHTAHAHRRPQRVRSCSRCSPVFDRAALFRWTLRGAPAPMAPSYLAELAVLGGRRPSTEVLAAAVPHLPVGARVRLRVTGRWAGATGTLERVGRTRYHVRLPTALVTAPFAAVEPVARG